MGCPAHGRAARTAGDPARRPPGLKNADHLKTFHDETIAHYEEHVPELEAVLAAAAG